MTSMLIQRLEEENHKLGGAKGGAAPKQKRKKTVKKASNSFIKFSMCLRPTFVRVLMSTHHAEGTLSQSVRLCHGRILVHQFQWSNISFQSMSHAAGGRRLRKVRMLQLLETLTECLFLPPHFVALTLPYRIQARKSYRSWRRKCGIDCHKRQSERTGVVWRMLSICSS